MDTATFKCLAQYNIWATQKLNTALTKVFDEDFFKDNGLFFKSIFGTLNHLLVGEHYLWFPRFSQNVSPILSLNTIIEKDRHQLLQALEIRSHYWIKFIEEIATTGFPQNLIYKTSTGQEMSLPYAETLLHVFNHATHHRGQISAALTAMQYDCPELDLVYMLVEEKINQNSNELWLIHYFDEVSFSAFSAEYPSACR